LRLAGEFLRGCNLPAPGASWWLTKLLMKSSLNNILLVPTLLAALVALPLLRADDTATVSGPTPAATPATPVTGKKAGHAHHDHHLQALSEKLGLTDDQKAKIEPIFKGQKEQLKALKADTSLTDDVRKATRHDIMSAGQQQIRVLLTADQQQKFDAMSKHHGKDKA
jgi:protein CpxP